jgi:hypothetical protein
MFTCLHVEGLSRFLERALEINHIILNRWVLAYASLIKRRLHSLRKPHRGLIQVDKTYIRLEVSGSTAPSTSMARLWTSCSPRSAVYCIGSKSERITKASGLLRCRTHWIRLPVRCLRPSQQRALPFRASKPCGGCAKAHASPTRKPPVERTNCSWSASDFRRLTKHEKEAGLARSAAYVRICDTPMSSGIRAGATTRSDRTSPRLLPNHSGPMRAKFIHLNVSRTARRVRGRTLNQLDACAR